MKFLKNEDKSEHNNFSIFFDETDYQIFLKGNFRILYKTKDHIKNLFSSICESIKELSIKKIYVDFTQAYTVDSTFIMLFTKFMREVVDINNDIEIVFFKTNQYSWHKKTLNGVQAIIEKLYKKNIITIEEKK